LKIPPIQHFVHGCRLAAPPARGAVKAVYFSGQVRYRPRTPTNEGHMIRHTLVTLSLALLFAAPVAAQTGQINGVVTDNTGAVVPGASVKAVETATGLARDAVSGADGRYTFTALRPATYDITAELTGFRSAKGCCCRRTRTSP
jgi:protocatechuate 3,4-dioxygenase beta subunit